MFLMKKVIKSILNIKKSKSKIRKLAESLDILLNDGIIFNKLGQAKQNFDSMLCDYYEECKHIKHNCQECSYLEDQLVEIDSYVLEARDNLEDAANEINKLVKKLQKIKK